MKLKFLAVLIAVLFAAPAWAGTLQGVTMPDTATVNGKSLVLNGMGLRKKSFIKVYVAGLYLPSKMSDARAIVAADTERRMIMSFLRGVGKGKICGAWDSGLVDNTANVTSELKSQFKTLCTYMADMSDGGKMTYT
ncbi:MAG: chalcone isomerase family protein, partial [bacterium]|nr:chalcone isomerase family protein [bacterium]